MPRGLGFPRNREGAGSGSDDEEVDVDSRVRSLFADVPGRVRIQLVGSRQRGDATALSDWDFRLEAPDCGRLAGDLPGLVVGLKALGALWDPLSRRAVYMVVLRGAIKVDFFPGDEERPLRLPWDPASDRLCDIDAHFWDWTLWLGGKTLGSRATLVASELAKMFGFLLEPLGADRVPASIGEAVQLYGAARDRHEIQQGVHVSRQLGDQVRAALARHGLV